MKLKDMSQSWILGFDRLQIKVKNFNTYEGHNTSLAANALYKRHTD